MYSKSRIDLITDPLDEYLFNYSRNLSIYLVSRERKPSRSQKINEIILLFLIVIFSVFWLLI